MILLERQHQILDILSKKKIVTVDQLCAQLYASGATIRRDLRFMESHGLLRRTHGGAALLEESIKEVSLNVRENENLVAKVIIAQQAIPLIQNGQTIFMDASSTATQLALRLNGFQNLCIITNGLKTAQILSEINGIHVYGTGGELIENAKSFAGTYTMEFISRFNADIAFFSCVGLHPTGGITDTNDNEANLKRLYIKNSKHAVLLCDSSKLGKRLLCKIADIPDVWKIISNIPLPAEYAMV